MENVRISFEVPSTGGYTVRELTERARRFVAELVEPGSGQEPQGDLPWALAPHTDEEISAELDRRWEHYLAHPESAIPHEKVFEEVMSRICAGQ